MPYWRARLRILRPLTLTVALALAACGTNPDWSGARSTGAAPSNLAPDQTASTLLKVADDTRAGGDLATAVSLYRRMYELNSGDPVPLARLGETLAQLQAYTEAAEAYRAAIALAPKDPELHRGLGNVLLALGKPQLALAQLEVAAAQNPNDARIYNSLGVAHDMTGQHDLAQESYRKGLSLSPDHMGLRNNLALSQALVGDYQSAVATLSDLVARPGATMRYRQNLALVYGLAGDSDHAASVARADLDEAAIRNNLAYYTLLRSLDDVGRTAAILGADVRATQLPQATATVNTPATAEAPPTAPPAPIADQPLPPPAVIVPPAPPQSAVAEPSVPAAPGAVVEAAAPARADMPASGSAADIDPPAPSAANAPTKPSAAPQQSAGLPNDPTDGALAETPGPEADTSAQARAEGADRRAEISNDPTSPPPPKRKSAIPLRPVTADMATTMTPGMHKVAARGMRIVVQIASFESETHARRLSEKLAAKGYKLVVARDHDRQGKEWFAVRTSDLASQEAAEMMAQELRNLGEFSAMVVRLPGSAAVSAEATVE